MVTENDGRLQDTVAATSTATALSLFVAYKLFAGMRARCVLN